MPRLDHPYPPYGTASLATAAAAVILLACGPGEQGTVDSPPGGAAPDTSAAAIWSHLESEQYAANWAMWPGKSALYSGGDPHGMLLTTYVNDVARDALANGSASMPHGAVIVKENYMPDSTLDAVTVMYKVSGYDPANGDWFWMKRLANGQVEASGRVAMCASCHSASTTDFLRTPIPAGRTGG